MGDVSRGVDLDSGVPVAIKRALGTGEQTRLRFEREVAALQRVRHPGVVRVLDHGEDAEGYWLVMAWVEGETLQAALRRGPLGESDVRALATRLASALAAVHEAGIVHRDVKPSNILLPEGRAESAVLVDFGLARCETDARATASGALVGSPMYMSPEQARGEPTHGPQADVFSLGATLYECASGRPPFRGTNALTILAKVLTLRPEPLGRVSPWTRGNFDRVVERMMSRNPADRPKDGADLLRMLDECHFPSSDRREPLATLSDVEVRPATILVATSGPPVPAHGGTTASLGGAAGELSDWADICSHFGGVSEGAFHPTLFVTFVTSGIARDDARLAARAALALRDHAPHAKVFVATGTSFVSQAGTSELTADFAESALRSLEEREASGVFLDGPTEGLLDATFVVEADSGAGRARLVGRNAEPAPGREIDGRAVPFVGRDLELRALELGIQQAREEGQASVIWVVAEAGRGKTALREVTATRLEETPGTRVLRTRCDALAAETPYAMLADLIATRFRLSRSASFDDQVAALTQRLPLEGFTSVMPRSLASPFGIVDAVGGTDPMTMQRELVSAIKEWFALDAAARPDQTLVLLIDDVQWSDASSWGVLESVLSGQGLHVSIVGFARPEFLERAPRPLSGLAPREMPLPKLGPRASEKLLRALMGRSAEGKDLSSFLRVADGSPLYLEELARTQIAGASSFAPAGSMLAMLQARCASLPVRQRTTLRVAAAVGHSFSKRVLTEILDGRELEEIDATLAALAREEFIVSEDGRGNFAEWSFRHALVRDAAHSLLAPEDQKTVHARVYRAEKRLGNVSSSALAVHAEKGGLFEEAATELVLVAESMLAVSDLLGATDVVQRIQGLVPSVPVRGEAYVIGAIAKFFLGDLPTALSWSLEGLILSTRRSRLWVRAVGYLAAIIGHVRPAQRPPALEDALAALLERPILSEELLALSEALALGVQTSAAMYPGDIVWTQAASARLQRLYEHRGALDVSKGWAALGLAWSAYYAGGTPETVDTWCARAVAHFETAQDRRNLVPCLSLWARALAHSLQRERSIQMAQRAIEVASAIGEFPVLFAKLHRAAAIAFLASADDVTLAERATASQDLALVLGALRQSAYVRCEASTGLSYLALASNEPDTALAHADEALRAVGICPIAAEAVALALALGDASKQEAARDLLSSVHPSSSVCGPLRRRLQNERPQR